MESSDVQARYSSPESTDYSAGSSRARYGLALHFKPRLIDAPRILDLGCGDAGLLSFVLRNAVPVESYWGVDIRESILDLAKSTLAPFPTNFSAAMPEAEEFDLVVALGLIAYTITDDSGRDIAEYGGLLTKALGLLAPGGRLIFTLRLVDHDGPSPMLLPDPQVFVQLLGVDPIYVLTPFPEECMLVIQRD